MADKIAIGFDEKSLEILNNVYPELRNAAVNIAVKMLAKDPMYKKYFCINCDEVETEEENTVELENLSNNSATQTTAPAAAPAVASWDDF